MLNTAGKVPLYYQLVDVLGKQIKENMKPHDKMLSEREISTKYNVSRTTVRLAMAELEKMGYIYKRHGKGTFVAMLAENKQNLMESYSFTDHMIKIGKVPKTKVLSFEVIKVNEYLAKHLGLSVGENSIKIIRLRLADDIPMMVETSYLPYGKFSTLTEELVNEKPLYVIFKEDYSQVIKAADEEFSASIVPTKEAHLLQVPANSPCLKLVRTTYGLTNQVIEFTLSIARSDQFIYRIRHNR
ncbi:GntR family transcriptional regulator [Cytobacillus sp. Hz8]|uniref:GntR family transcriptional regulator n=1 Tax=Cytobacillus sp. Hz8 TaxID=3347168 RepID=UPI0035E07981